jgi:hypothetical protein
VSFIVHNADVRTCIVCGGFKKVRQFWDGSGAIPWCKSADLTHNAAQIPIGGHTRRNWRGTGSRRDRGMMAIAHHRIFIDFNLETLIQALWDV